MLNIAVKGNFDDCQDLVKAMFADAPFRREMSLSAVNSINFARIAAQIPYYFAAALALGAPDVEVAVAVPTGNFGNVLAAWAARQMGVPIGRFIVASNRNDILARFLASNDMSAKGVEESLSPSMDIQVSSNFERLLYEFLGRDAGLTATTMADFRTTGRMAVPDDVWRSIKREFTGFRLDDEALWRKSPAPTGRPAISRTRIPPSAWPRRGRLPPSACRSLWRRPRIRQNSRMPSNAPSVSARHYRRTWPTYMREMSVLSAHPTTLPI